MKTKCEIENKDFNKYREIALLNKKALYLNMN